MQAPFFERGKEYMSNTSINICSQALLKIGASSITSFEDGTAEAEVAGNLYPYIRDALLSSYPWSFALTQTKLARLENTPIADFSYAYLLPSDFLRIVSAGYGNKGRGTEYKIVKDCIYTNLPQLNLTYLCRPDESNFPAYFCEALINKLAYEFCIPLTESTTRAEFLSKIAEDSVNRARSIDAQQSTPSKFEDFSLVEVRG